MERSGAGHGVKPSGKRERGPYVVIVDDDLPAAQVLQSLLEQRYKATVAHVPENQNRAWVALGERTAHLVIMNLRMLERSGITFLRMVAVKFGTPVILLAPPDVTNPAIREQAMRSDLVGYFQKPSENSCGSLSSMASMVLAAADSLLRNEEPIFKKPLVSKPTQITSVATNSQSQGQYAGGISLHVAMNDPELHARHAKVIAIGTSAGGPEALRRLLTALTPDCAGIVLVQHMPVGFVASFAQRLNLLCRIEVVIGRSGMKIEPGRAIVAPGGMQMRVCRNGSGYGVDVFNGPPTCGHRPSADTLLRSVAQVAGSEAVGVLLTGMGDDGADALGLMKEAGAFTIAQSRESCTVFGMPGEAVKRGCVQRIAPLEQIPDLLHALSA